MNYSFIYTLLIARAVELALAAYLKILSPSIVIPITFWTLISAIIFGIANQGFYQKQPKKNIQRRIRRLLKAIKLPYFLFLLMNLVFLYTAHSPLTIFAQTSILINWHALLYLLVLSQCRIKGEN
ncbi:hypothetical protein HZY93_07820 [Streptococcus danieliae]|uniref:Uncharacterized protein n=1 Tax=Streptococcus danieliae TaxID=747656 RepID=A0A7Z0LE57_9STRE|nr:hypothetical protein [Streptococcus danieliae]MBF0717910.1 hypothetical protein [Streptococcus danieliae]NYS49840.1 hypothetical protein [Streptococcus danieliae]